MKLLVGFVLIFCIVETVRYSGRSPSRSVWNYLKEFAWDRLSTDANNDRGPVVPLQVRITPIRLLNFCITLHMMYDVQPDYTERKMLSLYGKFRRYSVS